MPKRAPSQPLTDELRAKLVQIYSDPENRGSYGGVNRLYEAVRAANLPVTREQVREWLSSVATYTRYRNQRVLFRVIRQHLFERIIMGSPYYSVVSELKIPVDTSDDSKVRVDEHFGSRNFDGSTYTQLRSSVVGNNKRSRMAKAVKFFAKDPPCLDANIEVVKHWIKENQELQHQNLQREKELRSQLAELLTVKRKITQPPPSEKPCPICKVPVTTSNLARHMAIHQPRPAFQCEGCQAEFSRKEHLLRHCFIHSDGRPYQCARCGYISGRQDILCEHLRKCNASVVKPE